MLDETYSSMELGDLSTYSQYWERTPVRTADYTFTNLWGWSIHYGLEWRLQDGLCWIRKSELSSQSKVTYWAPVGDWHAVNWAALPYLEPGMVFERVPEALCALLAQQLGERIVIEETPDQWEYVYRQQDLATLSGRGYHKKKNHVNAYKQAYGEQYLDLHGEHMEAVLAMQHDWCEWRECEKSAALLAESDVVCSVLRSWNELPGLIGGALLVDGQIVAFSVGEPLDEQTMVIHFEKGRPGFRGVYQAINMCFSKYAGAGFAFINREQDAGEDGLRQAKQSYLPAHLVKKNRVQFV